MNLKWFTGFKAINITIYILMLLGSSHMFMFMIMDITTYDHTSIDDIDHSFLHLTFSNDKPYIAPSNYIDLSSWLLQIPEEPRIISRQLNSGYASKYFYYDTTDNSMTFMCPNEGIHTPTRTEMRHRDTFYVQKTAGYYYQNATLMISNTSHKTINNTYNYKLCIAQIHGTDGALPLAMINWDSSNGQLYTKYRLNGYIDYTPGYESKTKYINLDKVEMNDKFTLSIIVHNGNLSIYMNSVQYLNTNVSQYWTHGNYFKIGDYFHYKGVNMLLFPEFFTEVKVFKLENHLHQGVDFKGVTLCIGVQKGGTTSLRRLLSQIPDIYPAKTEYHFFENQTLYSKTLNKTIENVYKYGKNGRGFIDKMQTEVNTLTNSTLITDYWTKNPETFFYPHIAYIVSNDMIKYGTKVYVILRDSFSRFISAYWHYYIKPGFIIPDINHYLSTFVYNRTVNPNGDSHKLFMNDMKKSYRKYQSLGDRNRSRKSVFRSMTERFGSFVYSWTSNSVKPYDTRSVKIWIRSCYSVQLIPWIMYISGLNDKKRYFNSFKIIQFERLYDSDIEIRRNTMDSIHCYMHYHYNYYDTDGYDGYMDDCMQNGDHLELKYLKRNDKTRGYEADEELRNAIIGSYDVCNDWLKLLIDDYPHLVLGGFDWDKWNL